MVPHIAIQEIGGSGTTSSCARSGRDKSIFAASFNYVNYNYASRAIMICGEGI